MARNSLISEARLKVIERRQKSPKWGSRYEPAMRATRDEAPKSSRPTIVSSAKLGREIHVMSLAERAVCLLTLYHPCLLDLREQHMLSPVPAPHPLAAHPSAAGLSLPDLRGTIDVAERLDMLSEHPRVWLNVKSDEGNTESRRAAFPYLGDFLLLMQDIEGPYCVNWTVKADREDFSRTRIGGRPHVAKRTGNAERRHRLEEEYFADAGIRTVRIAANEIDEQLVANLTALFGWHAQALGLSLDVSSYLLSQYQQLISTRDTVVANFERLRSQTGASRHACLAVLYQGIWNRQLRVDLYRPILVDKPLKPERSDVLSDFHTWFAR